MEAGSLSWAARLARLRARTDALVAARVTPGRLPLHEALQAYPRLRDAARPLLDSAVATYADLCPTGYPTLEDNQILGPGGSLGVRFSLWHAFHVALENARKPRSDEPKPKGLAGVLDIRVKRMPGDPLPPRDPNDRYELAVLALRWDADRGWVEVRRVLPADWSAEMVAELLEAYLAGFAYDVAAGLPER